MLIHVAVTDDHIRKAGPAPTTYAPDHRDPVETALGDLTGQAVTIDKDPRGYIATIGAGTTTLVIDLPLEILPWLDGYYDRHAVAPISFDLTLEDWLHELLSVPGHRARRDRRRPCGR